MEKQALWLKTTIHDKRQDVRQQLLTLMENNSDKEFILLKGTNKREKDIVEVAQKFPRLSRHARIAVMVVVGVAAFLLMQVAAVVLSFWMDSAVVASWVRFAITMLSIFVVIKSLEYVPDCIEDRWGNLKVLSTDEYYIRTKNIPYLIGKIDKDIVRLNKEIAELESFYAKNS